MATSPDIVSPAIYLDGIPHTQFSEIMAHPGLMWHPYQDGGFWVVSRHSDVKAVSKQPKLFSSAIGHTNLWDLEADALEARRSIIDTDAPDHTRLRRLVSKAFTPRNISLWENVTREIAGELLDEFQRAGGGDWVSMVAAPLPIRVILSILGVPVSDADYLVELSNYLVEGTTDQSSLAPDAFGNTTDLRLLPFGSPASHALFEYGEQLGLKRKSDPKEDVVTQLVMAEEDGNRLSATEYRNLFHVLVFAGNETTRTAIAHGAMAFAEFPHQWEHLEADSQIHAPAVEELLRWAIPVLHMRRTATADTELAGTSITEGDKVVMWYPAANRDPAIYDRPFDFDISRETNPQFSFGGGGPHFCLGAFLGRMEIRILLEEMLSRKIALRQVGAPVRVASNFIHGILSVEMELV